MISMAANARRSFLFPAELSAAYAFLGDVRRSFDRLPYISITGIHSEDQYRLRYRALESGLYWVNIFCDAQVVRRDATHTIAILPLPGLTPVNRAATWNSMTCQGSYESRSVFNAMGRQTRVEITIRLAADLPPSPALRLVPPALLHKASLNILQGRIDEIIDGFVLQSIQSYPG